MASSKSPKPPVLVPPRGSLVGWPYGWGEEEAAWGATPEEAAQQLSSLFIVIVVTRMYLLQLSQKSRLTLIDIVTYLENYIFINGS